MPSLLRACCCGPGCVCNETTRATLPTSVNLAITINVCIIDPVTGIGEVVECALSGVLNLAVGSCDYGPTVLAHSSACDPEETNPACNLSASILFFDCRYHVSVVRGFGCLPLNHTCGSSNWGSARPANSGLDPIGTYADSVVGVASAVVS